MVIAVAIVALITAQDVNCEADPPTSNRTFSAGNDKAIIYCPPMGEEYYRLPDPDDCTQYYKCEGGKPILTKCPAGMIFDWYELTCTVSETAYCKASGPSQPGEVECPVGNDNTIIPNSKDCTTYYKCERGTPILIKCSEGLLFDWNLLTCTAPEKAYCTGSRPHLPGEIKCPAGNNNVIFPNSRDCTTYYKCERGTLILIKCSDGLLFDWNLLSCTVPEKAFCKGLRPPPVYPVTCPPVGSSVGNTLLPDPKDCHMFYQCVHGEPIPFNCPANLFWNNRKKVCDYICVR